MDEGFGLGFAVRERPGRLERLSFQYGSKTQEFASASELDIALGLMLEGLLKMIRERCGDATAQHDSQDHPRVADHCD